TGFDAAIISRVVAHLDSGFDGNQWTDPVIIANSTQTGSVNSLDAAFVAQKAVALPRPEIPNLPGIVLTHVGGGVDPQLSVPDNIVVGPHAPATVPVNINVAPGETTDISATFTVNFEDTVLSYVNTTQGSFWAPGSGWTMFANQTSSTQVLLTFFNSS